MEYFIQTLNVILLLLMFKTILSIWFFAKNFRYSGLFLSTHTFFDIINTVHKSYTVGIVSFILIPHFLIASLAEIYNSKYLRYANITSALLITTAFVNYNLVLQDIINYFLSYTVVAMLILSKSFSRIKKETFPLLTALVIQTFEIIAYKVSYSNYKIVNILNTIYYVALTIYLLGTINTPILDDPIDPNKIKIDKFKVEEDNSLIKEAA